MSVRTTNSADIGGNQKIVLESVARVVFAVPWPRVIPKMAPTLMYNSIDFISWSFSASPGHHNNTYICMGRSNKLIGAKFLARRLVLGCAGSRRVATGCFGLRRAARRV